MRLVLRLVEAGIEGVTRSVDVLEIVRPGDLGELGDLGLSLMNGKQLVAQVQQAIVATQSRDHAARRPTCQSCATPCQVKDYRSHQIATVFGQVTLRLPRFRCARCGRTEVGVDWPAHCRSTPELDQLRAHLSALMPYRVAAGLYWNIFCRLMPEPIPRPCAGAPWWSASSCATPLRPSRRLQRQRLP